VVGSPGYMSPEQVLARPIGPPSDVFALGAVLAYAATGRGPFRGDSVAVLLYKVAHEDPELDGMPDGLREMAEACLAKDPSARPTPAEIARRLAPGGAAALVREGWLPAALTGQLAARAVELLDLETTGPHHDAAPAGFGPPPSDYVPMPTLPQQPGASRRNTVVAGAAAVVAVALAAGLLVWLLPHSGGGTGDDSKSTATATHSPSVQASASAPASASASASPSPAATLGALPAAFVGRWKGDTVTIHGAPSTMDLTLKAGPVGSVVGRDHSVLDFLGSTYDCSGNWKLTRATATEIVLDTSGNTNPHPGICSDGSNNERLTLGSDGTVHYKSGDTLAGQPEGDLTKSGG
jgi:hypothetical protein